MADTPNTHHPVTDPTVWHGSSDLYAALYALTGKYPDYSIRRMIELAASGRVPLERRSGRWGSTGGNLPAVAKAIGLISAAEPEVRKRQRGPSRDHSAQIAA